MVTEKWAVSKPVSLLLGTVRMKRWLSFGSIHGETEGRRVCRSENHLCCSCLEDAFEIRQEVLYPVLLFLLAAGLVKLGGRLFPGREEVVDSVVVTSRGTRARPPSCTARLCPFLTALVHHL